MEHVGLGVISVTMENGEHWLYDSGWLTWLLKSNCKMEIKKFVFPGADGIDEYLKYDYSTIIVIIIMIHQNILIIII